MEAALGRKNSFPGGKTVFVTDTGGSPGRGRPGENRDYSPGAGGRTASLSAAVFLQEADGKTAAGFGPDTATAFLPEKLLYCGRGAEKGRTASPAVPRPTEASAAADAPFAPVLPEVAAASAVQKGGCFYCIPTPAPGRCKPRCPSHTGLPIVKSGLRSAESAARQVPAGRLHLNGEACRT